MHGGLFVHQCLGCGWESGGTYSPTIEGLPRSPATRVSVRWGSREMVPSAMKVLRKLSPAAENMPLDELAKWMVSGRPFELGLVIEHKLATTLQALADAGYSVTQEALP